MSAPPPRRSTVWRRRWRRFAGSPTHSSGLGVHRRPSPQWCRHDPLPAELDRQARRGARRAHRGRGAADPALGSLGVYGIVLAGWSSNNKYSLLGGLRASAQMISYEIALGMSTVAVLLLAGNVTLTDVIAKQAQSVFTWNVFPLSLAFFIFIVAAFA